MQDVIKIISKYNKLDLFITFICNPRWAEVQWDLSLGIFVEDCPNILAQIFDLKLKELLVNIVDWKIFGQVKWQIRVIEFQTKCLPDTYILLILDDRNKFQNTTNMDTVISTYIPDWNKYLIFYDIVIKHIIHRQYNINSHSVFLYLYNKICIVWLPKLFQEKME